MSKFLKQKHLKFLGDKLDFFEVKCIFNTPHCEDRNFRKYSHRNFPENFDAEFNSCAHYETVITFAPTLIFVLCIFEYGF